MVTFGRVAAVPELGLDVVVCADPDRAVRWVATNEMVDPRPFLEGGELLLFTGLEMAGWDASQWSAYVGHVVEAEVSGLAIAIGITHADLPQELAIACEEQALNLLTVPMGTSFVAISQSVAQMLEVSDRAAARTAVTMQRRLAQAARRSDAPLSIAEELAAYIEGSVWLVTPEREVLTRAGRTADRHAQGLPEIFAEIETLSSRGLGASSSWTSGQEHTLVQPIGLRTPIDAYLVVRTDGPLSEYQRTAVMTSLSMLTLDAANRTDQRRTARQLKQRALELLLDGERRAAELVLQSARADGDEPQTLPAEARLVRVAGPHDRLLRVLNRADEGRLPAIRLSTFNGDETEVHLLTEGGRIDALADELTKAMLRIGIGSSGAIDKLAISMRSAGIALARTTEARPIIWWDRLKNDGVTRLLDPRASKVLAEDLMRAIHQAPADDDDLLTFARCFLRHHGRTSVIGAELGIHRNTVRTRQRELEHVLNADLSDPAHRAALWLALEAAAAQLHEPFA